MNGSTYPNHGSGGDFRRITQQPENPFAQLIPDQSIAVIPSFELESGETIYNVPVAYKTYGRLSSQCDNAMVICHALTGSADVGDWWGPVLGGPGKAFDTTRFFVCCFNSLGSPYGSASPVTARNGDTTQEHYGPEFPLTTIRDDVNLFKLVLDDLGVKQIAAVIGGSMGGMLVLEFAYFGRDYVRSIVPIATSARYSAWGISWGEAQRQSIYSDPKYEDGYYPFDDPPSTGLGAARMSALLTYRSRDSFESRFGRNTPDPSRRQNINGSIKAPTVGNEHFAIHNEGHRHVGSPRLPRSRTNSEGHVFGAHPSPTIPSQPLTVKDPQFHGTTDLSTLPSEHNNINGSSSTPPLTPSGTRPKRQHTTYFSAQSYLRYQGEKFIKRFDANCYIAITRKLDTHDVSRDRVFPSETIKTNDDAVKAALGLITQPTLILGIQSDGLFTYAEQRELAASIPGAQLKTIDSPEGHDAFLLEFEQVNRFILDFEQEVLGDIMAREPVAADGLGVSGAEGAEDGKTKTSVFGEAEADDITAW